MYAVQIDCMRAKTTLADSTSHVQRICGRFLHEHTWVGKEIMTQLNEVALATITPWYEVPCRCRCDSHVLTSSKCLHDTASTYLRKKCHKVLLQFILRVSSSFIHWKRDNTLCTSNCGYLGKQQLMRYLFRGQRPATTRYTLGLKGARPGMTTIYTRECECIYLF